MKENNNLDFCKSETDRCGQYFYILEGNIYHHYPGYKATYSDWYGSNAEPSRNEYVCKATTESIKKYAIKIDSVCSEEPEIDEIVSLDSTDL